jgi:hypothetical protein
MSIEMHQKIQIIKMELEKITNTVK